MALSMFSASFMSPRLRRGTHHSRGREGEGRGGEGRGGEGREGGREGGRELMSPPGIRTPTMWEGAPTIATHSHVVF